MPLTPIPLTNIRLTDAFWTRWQRAIAETSLPAQFRQLEKTGRIEHFRRAARREVGGFEGYCFNDSDVYKWLEAAAYSQLNVPSKEVSKMIDELVGAISSAQEPDGYLDTFIQLKHPTLKWRNLISMHEMYCAGHLFEAAVALHECLKDDRLLTVATRLADLIDSRLGPDKRLGYCGHEEVELGLQRLSRATNEPRYARLARWMIEMRGSRPSPFQQELEDAEAMALSPYSRKMHSKGEEYSGEYCQDHLPVAEHTDVDGHAVRAMYLYIAAAELGDDKVQAALERCWDNLTKKRMYITGGIGPSGDNEGFTVDYDLPNLSSYAETCASCGLVFWANAMLKATGRAEYADVMERALYNGAISGISLAGDHFFYANPLESRGNDQRAEWFGCACCPPNIARLIASVGRYVAGTEGDAFYLHILIGLDTEHEAKGVRVKIRVESNYPWSGAIKIHIDPEQPVEFPLHVRVPAWADDVDISEPAQDSDDDRGYAVFTRRWVKGDVIDLDFVMQPKWIEADPRVRDNLGRIALTRGPIVYCAESPDLGFAPQLLGVDPEVPVMEVPSKDLGGIVRLETRALAENQSTFPNELYVAAGTIDPQEVDAKFIPYYAWANRGPSDMQVWIRRI